MQLRGSLGSFASPVFTGFAFVARLGGGAILPFYTDPFINHMSGDPSAASIALGLSNEGVHKEYRLLAYGKVPTGTEFSTLAKRPVRNCHILAVNDVTGPSPRACE